jgi:acyl-homoserine lactone acylase PvdQ
VVSSTKANLRDTPNASSQVLLELEKGEALDILEEKAAGPWYKVRHISSGKRGWVHGNTIRLTVPNHPSPVEQSASGNDSPPAARPQRESRATTGGGDTYINSFGEEVPRPRRSASVPDGASARCRDGTYSFSRNRRGTCSHHGGVAQWL